MNKTVTINISGIIFHIEEDAYEKLSKYLNTIKGYFTGNESGNEIIADIEARIAELLQGKVSQFKQVVLMADVDDVINALGKPEDFGIETESQQKDNSSANASGQYQQEPIKKRMFRDPDEKAIGGVCSGIAHYFDVDVVWIRLATFLLIFFGGVSLWVYIILWIVIPEAKTTADKLSMRGERVNINNISKAFKEEMDDVKNRFEKYGNTAGENIKNAAYTGRSRAAEIIGGMFRIVGRLFGVFLIFIGILFMILLMTSITGISVGENSSEIKDWTTIFFNDRSYYYIGLTGLILVIAVPAFMLLYGGIKMLFRIKYSNRWLNISAGLIWITGLILAMYAGIKTASDFSENGKSREVQVIKSKSDTLVIKAVNSNLLLEKYGISVENDIEDENEKHHSDYSIHEKDGKKMLTGTPKLKIIPTSGGNFEIVINKKSRGDEKRVAYNRAKSINYSYTADSLNLILDELFYLSPNEKFRFQEVEIIVKVPKGKVVYLDKTLRNVIYDVDNVTNTYDQDMLERRWIMTEKGLECIDCRGIENVSVKSHHFDNGDENEDEEVLRNHDIKIDDNGVKIDGKDARVHIGEKEIKVISRDANVVIDKNGVEVKERKN